MILAGAEDDKKMPLLDHLVELRKRLLYSFAGLIIAFGICFFFAQHIFNFLAQPLATILLKEANRHFIYTDLTEVFFTQVKVAFFGVFAVAAIVTPPDPFSMMSLALPIVVLYEISIWSAKLVEKKRAEREEALDAELNKD